MKKVHEIQNFRMIKVSFVAPTNSRGARIKLTETKRYNEQKTETKIFSYCYQTGDTEQQAFDILTKNGFDIVARCSDVDNYIILCNNWGEDFKKINELKDNL